MQGNRIRTLLIEDSAFMRQMIADIITMDGDIDLVGTAANGREGSDKAMALKPDVVITDMVMPEYDGLYVVKSVMKDRPVPIILLSSLNRTNPRIFDALQCGAFEFIDKPHDLDAASIRNYPLRSLIKEAFRADVARLKDKKAAAQRNTSAHTFTDSLQYELVAIGASTGGPGAIESILINLPENLKVPVVVAQHMPARFLETFSVRLNEHRLLPVKLLKAGEVIQGGNVYILSGDVNLRIEWDASGKSAVAVATKKQYAEFNKPSVDCLFESVAATFGRKSIGVILTGMGKDGMEGLLKMRQQGGLTIAQDEASAVVYGMPKAALQHGAVERVVPLKEIPGFIVSSL